ncbi:MAG: hypothetical protein K0S23_2090 [Fluviicola sp.]|jgi:hypothetical protein|nr:hypothetical protein [Fluviicola sp.]
MESRQFSTVFIDYIVSVSRTKNEIKEKQQFNSGLFTIFVYSLHAGNTTLYW